jgi:hypothetical protein
MKGQTGPTGDGAARIVNASFAVDGELRPRTGMERADSLATASITSMVFSMQATIPFVVTVDGTRTEANRA